MRFAPIVAIALGSLVSASPLAMDAAANQLDRRGVCKMLAKRDRQTEKAGDGNPHQNFIFKQVSGTTDCTNNPSGSAAITKGETVGWSLSIGGAADFITGGFSVSESKSTGSTNAFGCKTNDGTHDGSLCVFERIQLTAFTANTRECSVSSCGGTQCGDWGNDVVIFAPNDSQGDCFYDNFQLGFECVAKGSEHRVENGPAGGPQFIACSDLHNS